MGRMIFTCCRCAWCLNHFANTLFSSPVIIIALPLSPRDPMPPHSRGQWGRLSYHPHAQNPRSPKNLIAASFCHRHLPSGQNAANSPNPPKGREGGVGGGLSPGIPPRMGLALKTASGPQRNKNDTRWYRQAFQRVHTCKNDHSKIADAVLRVRTVKCGTPCSRVPPVSARKWLILAAGQKPNLCHPQQHSAVRTRFQIGRPTPEKFSSKSADLFKAKTALRRGQIYQAITLRTTMD